MTDYSKHIVGKSIIDHRERIGMRMTTDEYIFYHAARPTKTYADYWKECGYYPSEVRKLISQLKVKGYLNFFTGKNTVSIEKQKPPKEKRISFQDCDIYNKLSFAVKFKDWSEEKRNYYWNAADEWSENGGKKVNWYKTIANWERRDSKEGKLKFKENKSELPTNFFENR